MDVLSISRLTDRQRLCLRLVHAHMSSKEIAPHLGVEPGTVDQHIKAAMAVLGVGERRQAARMLVEYEAAISSGSAGMAAEIGPGAPALDNWVRETMAAIGHGFRNILNFSGRDTSEQFWPYAAFLLILNCAISNAIVMPQLTHVFGEMQQFAATHPGESVAGRFSEFQPVIRTLISGICLVALAHLALIAAAIARRLQAGSRFELWVHLALPVTGFALLLKPSLLGPLISAQMLSCIVYALVRGGAPERIGASILLFGAILNSVFVFMSFDRLTDEIILLGIDVLTFFSFALLALRANRFWPIWMSAVLGFGAATHVATQMNPQVTQWAFLFVAIIGSLPIMLLMIVGTHAHRVRLAQYGVDPAWSGRFALARRSGTLEPASQARR